MGLEHKFDKSIDLRVEAYYKDYSNISPLWQNRDHLENYPEARNDNALVEFNGITSKGVELFLKYDAGKNILVVQLCLAKATDDIKDIQYDGLLIKRAGKYPDWTTSAIPSMPMLITAQTNRGILAPLGNFTMVGPERITPIGIRKSPRYLHFYAVHGLFNGVVSGLPPIGPAHQQVVWYPQRGKLLPTFMSLMCTIGRILGNSTWTRNDNEVFLGRQWQLRSVLRSQILVGLFCPCLG